MLLQLCDYTKVPFLMLVQMEGERKKKKEAMQAEKTSLVWLFRTESVSARCGTVALGKL